MALTQEQIERRIELLLTDPVQLLANAERDALRRCAVPRWFDRALYDAVLAAGSVDAGLAFDDVCAHSHVTALPGERARFAVREPYRSRLFRDWWEDDASPHAAASAGADPVAPPHTSAPSPFDGPTPPALLDLSGRLAAWFAADAHADALERLYHLVLVDRVAAADLFARLIDDAVARFDLPACHAILRSMDDRQTVLGQSLAAVLMDKRHTVTSRALWAREHYETITYYEREQTRPWLDDLVAGRCGDDAGGPCWLLHIFAGGGLGKTMFIRATIARGCVPQGIPCARIDFDFVPHLAVVAREPWRLLLGIAEQLNPQWPARPFDELLSEYSAFVAQAGARPIPLARDVRAVDADADRQVLAGRVLERFSRIVAEIGAPGGSTANAVVLIFDTFENLRTRGIDPEPLFQLLHDLHARVPRVRFILAGRFDLTEAGSGGDPAAGRVDAASPPTPFARRFAGVHRKAQLLGFTIEEARQYLAAHRNLAEDARLGAIVTKACGKSGATPPRANPFVLALLADIVRATPSLTAAEIEAYPDANLAYLIERVVERIEDRLLRWLLRYGVVPRQLTLDYVRQVMLPHLAQVQAAGRVDEDDVSRDGLPPAVLARQPWAVDTAAGAAVDVDALWRELYTYTSHYSWVASVPGVNDTVAFHPDVVDAMRRLIEPKAIYPRLVADSIRYFTSLRDAAASAERARWVREIVYHRYRLDPADADAACLAELGAIGANAPDVRDLADAILTEVVPPDRVSPAVRARASYVLAYDRLSDPRLLGDDERLRVEGWLKTIEVPPDVRGPAVDPARLAFLRGRLALGDGDTAAAAEACAAGLDHPADVVNEVDLRTLHADTLAAQRDFDAAIDERRKACDLAGKAPDAPTRRRCVDLALALGAALAGRDRLEEAADAFESAWREAERRRTEPGSGIATAARALLGLVDANVRMGRERRAVALGEERLGELRAWGAGAGASGLSGAGVVAHVEAEIRLADGQPDRAAQALAAALGPTAVASAASPTPAGGAGIGPGSIAWVDLEARVAAAMLDIGAAVRRLESLAEVAPRPGEIGGAHHLIRCANLHATHTGDWREARRYLDHAAAVIQPDLDPDATIRWAMVDARVGSHVSPSPSIAAACERLRAAGFTESVLQQATGMLRAEAAVAAAALAGPTPDIVVRLNQALGAVRPPPARLRMVEGLALRPRNSGVAAGEPASANDASERVAWLHGARRDDALDPGLVAARRAAGLAWVGDPASAQVEATEAVEVAKASGKLARLRCALRLHDAVGWGASQLAGLSLPNASDADRAAMPGVCGMLSLEHAERLWAASGPVDASGDAGPLPSAAGSADPNAMNQPTLVDRTARLIADATTLLGTSQPAWSARIAGLNARLAWARGDEQAAETEFERGTGLFEHVGDSVEVLLLHAWWQQRQQAHRSPFPEVTKGVPVPRIPSTGPATDPQPPPPAALEPRHQTLSVVLSTDPEGAVEGRYTTHAGETTRRWPEADSLFQREPGQSVGDGFIRAASHDWAALAHILGGIAGIALEVGAPGAASAPEHTRLALSVDPDLAWVPWELARPVGDRPPVTLDPGFAVHRRPAGGIPSRPADRLDRPRVLVVRPGSDVERATARGIEQAAGISLSRLYRMAGVEVDEVIEPDLRSLQIRLLGGIRPTVLHVAGGLTDRLRGRPALKLGGGRPYSEHTRQYKVERDGDSTMLTTTDLAMLIKEASSLALVVLDADTPPTVSERLHKLCLRNAFLAEVVDISGIPAAIGIGLGESDAQHAMANALAGAVAEGGTSVEIMTALRRPAPRQPVDPFTGRIVGWEAPSMLAPILPYAAAAMWTSAPDAPIIPRA